MEGRVEEIHNRIADIVTDPKKKYTMSEIISAVEIIKSEVVFQHLSKQYGVQKDTS